MCIDCGSFSAISVFPHVKHSRRGKRKLRQPSGNRAALVRGAGEQIEGAAGRTIQSAGLASSSTVSFTNRQQVVFRLTEPNCLRWARIKSDTNAT